LTGDRVVGDSSAGEPKTQGEKMKIDIEGCPELLIK
jgi:hypothetical protein